MNSKTIFAFAAGSLATAGLAVLIAAGPEHDHSRDTDTDRDHNEVTKNLDHAKNTMNDPEQFMKEMIRISTPNEHHKELGEFVGTWNATTSFVMDPGKPPMQGTGTLTAEWVLGKRFIMTTFKSEFMGEAFKGIGYHGYDIAHERYVSTWIDTMTTNILYMTGSKTDDGSVELIGTATSPMGDNPTKLVTKWIDDNTWTDEFYDQLPDGSWLQSGTITYTRD